MLVTYEDRAIRSVLAYPEFIQLMDDDIVSLIGLTLIVNPSYRDHFGNVMVSRLTLSLYLMTQCQMKLHHPVLSPSQLLDCCTFRVWDGLYEDRALDQLLVKLILRKIFMHLTVLFQL